MLKKIFCLGAILLVAFSLAACGNNYVYKDGDFRLTVTVDKTEARVGDTVTVTATLENLSGQDVRIQPPPPTRDHKSPEDLIRVGTYPEDVDYLIDDVYSMDERFPTQMTLKKDLVAQKTVDFVIEKLIDYNVIAAIVFYSGKGYKESFSVKTKTIEISVGGVE